jgi:hypothetical protein
MMLRGVGHAAAGFGVAGMMLMRVVTFLILMLVTGVIMHFMFHGSSSKND